jgi:AcrR family transcriptional regulator
VYDVIMATPARSLDRRQRKSRAALQAGLLMMIAAKPYDAITIEEIAAAADVTRATYYAHYSDKAALLWDACEQQLLADVIPAVSSVSPVDGSEFKGAGVAVLLRHALEHADPYRVILSGAAGSQVRARLITAIEAAATGVNQDLVGRLGLTPPVPLDFVTGTFVAALVYTVETVLRGEHTGSPEEVAATFMRSQSEGLRWSLGLS